MGIIFSCCDPDPEESEDSPSRRREGDGSGDREGLISEGAYTPIVSIVPDSGARDNSTDGGPLQGGSMVGQGGPVSGSERSAATSLEDGSEEEGSNLEDILTEMASKVVELDRDGNDLNTSRNASLSITGEPAFVQERAKEYGRRLQKVSHQIFVKHSALLEQDRRSKLADVGQDVEKVLASTIISDNDAMLIREVATRAQEAVMEFRVEPVDDLVVKIGRDHQPSDQYQDQQDILTK